MTEAPLVDFHVIDIYVSTKLTMKSGNSYSYFGSAWWRSTCQIWISLSIMLKKRENSLRVCFFQVPTHCLNRSVNRFDWPLMNILDIPIIVICLKIKYLENQPHYTEVSELSHVYSRNYAPRFTTHRDLQWWKSQSWRSLWIAINVPEQVMRILWHHTLPWITRCS